MFEENVVVIDPSHPNSVEAQERIEVSNAAKATKEASCPSESIA